MPSFAQVLLDPLAGDVDYSYEGVDEESWIALPYTVNFGFTYAGQGGLTRRGGKIKTFWGSTTALVADLEQVGAADDRTTTSHPTRDGVGQLIAQENQTVVQLVWHQTVTFWWIFSPRSRGLIDRNVGFQDGAVVRYDALHPPPVDTPSNPGDHPMRPLPFDKLANAMNPGSVAGAAIWVPAN